MRPYLESLWALLVGVLKRAWAFLPALVLDPFDVVAKLTNDEIDTPMWVTWTLFMVASFVAVYLTYHDARMATARAQIAASNAQSALAAAKNADDKLAEIGRFIGTGNALGNKCVIPRPKPQPAQIDALTEARVLEVETWTMDVCAWLRLELPHFEGQFLNDVVPYTQYGSGEKMRDVGNYMRRRLWQLGEIQKTLAARRP